MFTDQKFGAKMETLRQGTRILADNVRFGPNGFHLRPSKPRTGYPSGPGVGLALQNTSAANQLFVVQAYWRNEKPLERFL